MNDGTYILDGKDRVVGVTGALQSVLGPFVGSSIWEASPLAEAVLSPHFARARSTGQEVEFTAFFRARLAHRRVVPAEDTLTVFVTPLVELDLRTLETLTESLRAIEDELAGRASAQPGRRSPASLQALP